MRVAHPFDGRSIVPTFDDTNKHSIHAVLSGAARTSENYDRPPN